MNSNIIKNSRFSNQSNLFKIDSILFFTCSLYLNIRAFLPRKLNILVFIISKSYFINFNIPLYNPPNIKNFYYFTTLFKYSFFILSLCFFFIYLLCFQITTIKQIYIFFTILLQWAARHSSLL